MLATVETNGRVSTGNVSRDDGVTRWNQSVRMWFLGRNSWLRIHDFQRRTRDALEQTSHSTHWACFITFLNLRPLIAHPLEGSLLLGFFEDTAALEEVAWVTRALPGFGAVPEILALELFSLIHKHGVRTGDGTTGARYRGRCPQVCDKQAFLLGCRLWLPARSQWVFAT